MSKLSKAVRKIQLGPLVTQFVRLAQKLLGKGTGPIKKKLVIDLVVATLRRLKEADLDVPDNVEELLDELIEQAVELLTESGEFESRTVSADGTGFVQERVGSVGPVKIPVRSKRTGGRPKGSKNKPKITQAKEVPAEPASKTVPVEEMFDMTDLDIDE